MISKRVLAFLTVALATSAVVISTAAAGMQRGAAPRVDLSTRAGVDKYLRSLGLNPSGFVVQRGARNYAGPNCPGASWNCTSARRVIQIGTPLRSSSGSSRTFAAANQGECTVSPTRPTGVPTETSTTQDCEIVQTGTSNSARCVEKSSAPVMTQTCKIDQTGTTNDAYVLQDVDTGIAASMPVSPLTQNTTQRTKVTQRGVSNRLDATQDVNQSLTGSSTQQDAHLSIGVCQGGTGTPSLGACAGDNSGANIVRLHQQRSGDAKGSAGPVTQNQDTLVRNPAENDFCVPQVFFNANLCSNIEQNSTRSNSTDQHQHSHLRGTATGTAGPVTQEQHRFDGGIDGHVVQPNGSPDAANKNNSHLHLTDDLSGPKGSNQRQDPGLGCCSLQAGNGNSKSNEHLVGRLRASEANAVQVLDVSGDCISNGSCLVLTHGKVNGDQASDKCTAESSFGEGFSPATCTAEVHCTTNDCVAGPISESLSLALLGFDAMDFRWAIDYVFPAALPGAVMLP